MKRIIASLAACAQPSVIAWMYGFDFSRSEQLGYLYAISLFIAIYVWLFPGWED